MKIKTLLYAWCGLTREANSGKIKGRKYFGRFIMTVIVCIDTGRGMTFFGRRQSTDSVLRKRIASLARGKKLYMSAYSASQFGADENIVVCDGAPTDEDAVWFTECSDPAPYADETDELVIYRWNRTYPRELKLTFDPYESGMTLYSITDFEGSSHPRITEEIWRRERRG